MTALAPLVTRELREESRQAPTYWMRVVVALCLVFTLIPFTFSEPLIRTSAGAGIFPRLQGILFASIWILVPLLVADCVSREKREGTLGLLFLTPLTGGSIMGGKCFVHALRSSTLLVATIPVLAIPVLLGGVDQWDIIRVLILDAAALVAALGCGLLASVLSKRWTRATLLAAILSFLALDLFLNVHSILVDGSLAQSFPRGWAKVVGTESRAVQIVTRPGFVIPPNGPWNVVGPGGMMVTYNGGVTMPVIPPRPIVPPKFPAAEITPAIGMLGAAVGAFLLLWLWAGRRLPMVLSETGPTATQHRLERKFCTPVLWADGLKYRLRASLDRNPIGWLEHYSWNSRLTKWGWCLAAVIYEMFVFNNLDFDHFQAVQPWFFGILVAGLALNSANSFSREKESGALELLLVTPLTEWQIIFGRLGGLWMQMVPGAVTYAFMFEAFHSRRHESWFFIMLWTLFLTPFVGLAVSMSRYNLFTRWIITLGFALILPVFLVWIQAPAGGFGPMHGMLAGSARYQLIFAFAALMILNHTLRARDFVRRAV